MYLSDFSYLLELLDWFTVATAASCKLSIDIPPFIKKEIIM